MGKKKCSNCIKGTAIIVNDDILCRYKGVVSPDYVCFQHRNVPAPKNFKDLNYKCYDCEFFSLAITNSINTEPIGLCKLFSVRQYNGKEKNACSKFSKKSQLDVC